MDISGLSVSMSTSSINTGLEVAMLSKVLDSAEIAGEALNEMMEAVAYTVRACLYFISLFLIIFFSIN